MLYSSRYILSSNTNIFLKENEIIISDVQKIRIKWVFLASFKLDSLGENLKREKETAILLLLSKSENKKPKGLVQCTTPFPNFLNLNLETNTHKHLF